MPISIELIFMLVRTLTLVGALLVLAWGFHRWRRSAARDAQRMFEQLDLIRGELLLLSDRMQQLETATPTVIERPAVPEARVPAPVNHSAPRGYEVAARLAKGGATCDELISSCGLSRHEAELLLRLHRGEAAQKNGQAQNGQMKIDNGQLKANEERRARLSVVG